MIDRAAAASRAFEGAAAVAFLFFSARTADHERLLEF